MISADGCEREGGAQQSFRLELFPLSPRRLSDSKGTCVGNAVLSSWCAPKNVRTHVSESSGMPFQDSPCQACPKTPGVRGPGMVLGTYLQQMPLAGSYRGLLGRTVCPPRRVDSQGPGGNLSSVSLP